MSLSGWIFMVGFRVVDVGLLIAWLIWFFLRVVDTDPDDDDEPDERGGGNDRALPDHPHRPTGGRALPQRRRDHAAEPRTAPPRVRRPARERVPTR